MHPVPAPSSSPPPKSRALRVLISDDNVDGADALALLVNLEGHEVGVAHDGEEALRVAGRMRPDVAILDIGMPGLNGYEVASRLRQTSDGPLMLIVAMTGRDEAEDKQRARSSGFDAHFTKPVEPAALLGRIAAWQQDRRGQCCGTFDG